MDNVFYELMAKNNGLQIHLESGRPVRITGDVEVRSGKTLFGVYNCEVLLDVFFPKSFPKVFEKSNRIPKLPDRHVNNDGSLCLAVTPIAIIQTRKGINIVDFFNDFLIPYLAAQIWFDKTGAWAGGEYVHGEGGILQYFREQLGILENSKLKSVIKFYLDNNGDINRKKCNCYSGKQFTACCATRSNVLKELPINYLKEVHSYL